MTSEIALFPPSPRTHVTDVVVAESGLHARIKRDVPLAIELTARRSLFLPLFIFFGRKRLRTNAEGEVSVLLQAGCVRSRYEESMICFSDESFSASVAGFDAQSPLGLYQFGGAHLFVFFVVILAEIREMPFREAADRRPLLDRSNQSELSH